MEKELISVIVPIYKVEKYLEECILSIVNQTYKNLEIILIDDGSPDKCGSMCNEYAKKDKRIKVIHKENKGISSARNLGIEMATGEYIFFVDSDDYLFKTSIEKLYKDIIEYDADISIGGVQDSITIYNPPKVKKVVDKIDGLKLFFTEKIFKCTVWAKLYKRSLIENERFDEEKKLVEDFDFSYRILKKSSKTVINTYERVYFYRIREDSLMRQKYSKDFEKEIDFSEEVLFDVEKSFPELKNYAIRRYQRVIVSCIDKYFREKGNTNDVSYLFIRLKKYPNKLDIFQRLKLFMLLHCKEITRRIYIHYGKISK